MVRPQDEQALWTVRWFADDRNLAANTERPVLRSETGDPRPERLDVRPVGPPPSQPRVSRFLRDLPHEFGAFVRPLWPEDPAIPEYLVDLALHELVEMAVDAAEGVKPGERTEHSMSLETRFALSPATRRAKYRYRVQELSVDPESQAVPVRAQTDLLVYRDTDHEVRFLELTPFGCAFVDRIAAGDSLQVAVGYTAQALSEPLDDAFLVRAATLLGDLIDRGVVRAHTQTPG